jgi:hypothetical protein
MARKHPGIAKRYGGGSGGPRPGDLLRDLRGGFPKDLLKKLDREFPHGELRKHLEKELELDLDELHEHLGKGFPGMDPETLREELGKGFPGGDLEKHFRFALPGGKGGAMQLQVNGKSIKIEQGPDGVRAEVRTKNEDGEETVEVLEAESMEELREKHPDLFGGMDFSFGVTPFGPGGGGFFFGKPGEMRDLFKVFPRRFRGGPFGGRPGLPGAPRPQRLGVMVETTPDGLVVKDVQEGTLAEDLGLKSGDLLLSINDEPVRDVPAVKRALGKSAGTKVIIQRDGEEKILEKEAPKPERPRRSMKV